MQWTAFYEEMKHIQWVLNDDDDVVVHRIALQCYVLRHFNPLLPMIIGDIEPNSKPHQMGK